MVQKEIELLTEFINGPYLRGWFISEFPIGLKKDQHFQIDMICVEGIEGRQMRIGIKPSHHDWFIKEMGNRAVWLLEAKVELNAEVVGQLLIDKYLFSREFPSNPIRGLGVISRHSSTTLQQFCSDNGISVFLINPKNLDYTGYIERKQKYWNQLQEIATKLQATIGGKKLNYIPEARFYLRLKKLRERKQETLISNEISKVMRIGYLDREAVKRIAEEFGHRQS